MKCFFTFLLFLIAGYTHAQVQNVWCFGSSAGLDFNSGNPVAINTSIRALEGSASVCDKNGQLLFYTEGAKVWDRNHNVMPNGSSLMSLSTQSTTQAAVIVPMPDDSEKYYLFSLSDYNTRPLGGPALFYSIIDMKLNGGLGDVVAASKGIFVDSGLTEKLTAVAGKGQSVWVMVRSIKANEYKAFAVTTSGVNTSPVISVCGEFGILASAGGEIKFSPNRRKMAAACTGSYNSGNTGPSSAGLELYDFDPATGIVSNAVKVDEINNKYLGIYYGVNFSPDNSKLYGAVLQGINVGNTQHRNGVFQFDLNVPPNAIAGTRTQLTSDESGAIKLGPNGKMYIVAKLAGIDVINFPNLAGTACQFEKQGVTLVSGINSAYGFPNEIPVPGGNDDTVYYCNNGNGIQLIDSSAGQNKIWQVISGPGIISGSGDTVTVTTTANTRVLLSGVFGSIPDTTTIIVLAPKLYAGADDTVFGCNGFLDTLHAKLTDTLAGLTYDIAWQPGAFIVAGDNTLQPVIAPASATTYKITVTTPATQGGCIWRDSVHITPVDKTVHAGFAYTITGYGCSGDTVMFANNSTGIGTLRYRWDFGDGMGDAAINTTHIYKKAGQYVAKLYVFNEFCMDSISQVISISPFLDASFTVDKDTICQYDTVLFTNTSIGDGIISNWDLGDGVTDVTTDPQYIYNTPGLHKITLAVSDNRGCHDTALRFVQVDAISSSSFEVRDSVCVGQAVTLIPQTDSTTIELRWGFEDGIGTVAANKPMQYSYDRAGDFIVRLSAKFRACPELSYQDVIHVYPFPVVDLGPDTAICPGDASINLLDRHIHQPGEQYYWSTGETTPSISISKPGIYTHTVTSQYGCATTDTIEVRKGCYIAIPNAFSPNGDGINDFFFPRDLLSDNLTGFHMRIFNRWGQQLFETNTTNGRGWDGTFNGNTQPADVYIYIIEVVINNKSTEKHQGNVTLLR